MGFHSRPKAFKTTLAVTALYTRWRVWALVCVLFALAPSAYAQSCDHLLDPGHTVSIMKEVVGNNGYKCEYCARNIINLLKAMADKGHDISTANVLFFTPNNIVGMIRARGKEVTHEWSYHVALESNGIIFDFDFPGETKANPLESYVEELFVTFPVGISVRVIPAKDYLKYMGGSKEKEIFAPKSPYPLQNLAKYIRQHRIK